MDGRLVPRGLLNVEQSLDGTTAILRLQGEIDLSNVHIPESAMRDLVADRGCDKIVLDMTGLDFIDSAGIAWLVRELESSPKGDGSLLVRGVTPNVRRVLALTGVDEKLAYTD